MQALDRFNMVGTLVDGRYRVERVVGEGGFGVVYRAHHVRLDGLVALKVLKLPDNPVACDAMIAAFENEGKLLFSLASRHDGFVRVLESGSLISAAGQLTPFLVLEWLEGATLDEELRYRDDRSLPPMSLDEMIALLDLPVRALSAAHRDGIAHRDLKPGNLFLVSRDGVLTPKVLDLGAAKLIEKSLGATSVFSHTAGAACSFTPAYGAPEQWRRELGATGPWTDVHALALLCLEVLTGRPPYRGGPASILAACVDEQQRPTPRSLGLDVPHRVEEAFRCALSVDPRNRFVDADAFWQAVCGGYKPSAIHRPIIECLSGQSVPVSSPAENEASIPAGTTQPPSSDGERAARPATVTPPRLPKRSKRFVVGAFAFVLVIVALAVGLRPPKKVEMAPAAIQPLAPSSAATAKQVDAEIPTDPVSSAAAGFALVAATEGGENETPRPIPARKPRQPMKGDDVAAPAPMPSLSPPEPESLPSRRK